MSNVSEIRDKFRKASNRRYMTTGDLEVFGQLRLQSLTARESRVIKAKLLGEYGQIEEEKFASSFGWMVIFMVVDEHGDQIFGEMDLDWLNELDWGVCKPLYDDMNRHAETPSVEKLKKNCVNHNGDVRLTSPESSEEWTSTECLTK